MNAAGKSLQRLALWAAVPASVGALWGLNSYMNQEEQNPVPVLVPDIPAGGGTLVIEPQIGQPEPVIVRGNVHTARWNIYTNKGRESFTQGRIDEAEVFFRQAIEEAKKGFGEDDAHVASSLNNLAELHRLKKEFDKAEPLYLEAVDRLQESMGPENPTVGYALHNLGAFYLLQNNFPKAIDCYERALKIKGRGLGLNHPEYANTMFHLGKVMQLSGKLTEAESLIRQSIQILEEGGFGQIPAAIMRMTVLSELLVQTNQLQEAELLQRKVLHNLEITQGPEAANTISAMERLANTLLLRENFDEAEDLLKRCLECKQKISNWKEIQIWDSLYKLACVIVGRAGRLASDSAKNEALAEYDKALTLTQQALGIAENNWNEATAYDDKVKLPYLMTLVQSLSLAGLVGLKRLEATGSEADEGVKRGEEALRECLAVLEKENGAASATGELLKVKVNCTEQLGRMMRKLHGNTREVKTLEKQGSKLESELKKLCTAC